LSSVETHCVGRTETTNQTHIEFRAGT
jgi:hypothetical protein